MKTEAELCRLKCEANGEFLKSSGELLPTSIYDNANNDGELSPKEDRTMTKNAIAYVAINSNPQ